MNKEIYKSAFAIINTQNEICNNFENIGFSIDYSSGAVGKALENLLNQAYTILDGSLDFNRKTHCRKINISGYTQEVCFDVLYVGNYDEDWTITEDDFSDFIYKAADSEELQELFWKAMVDRDENAKTHFNKISTDFQIGKHWKD